MEILIPSTESVTTIFLMNSSPHVCIYLTRLKITSTQDRLYAPSVTLSMNSLSSSSNSLSSSSFYQVYNAYCWKVSCDSNDWSLIWVSVDLREPEWYTQCDVLPEHICVKHHMVFSIEPQHLYHNVSSSTWELLRKESVDQILGLSHLGDSIYNNKWKR